MSVDLTKGATVELVKTLSDDLRTKDDNTKYSSAGAAMRDKANVNGYYEDLVSGGTDQIISSVFEEDSEPYLFRTSGGSIDIGDREENTIVGGTVAWNQLYNPSYVSESSSKGITVTPQDGGKTVLVNGTTDDTGDIYYALTAELHKVGHKLLVVGCPSGGASNTYRIYLDGHGYSYDTGVGRVFEQTVDNKRLFIYVNRNGVTLNNAVFKPQLFDLTQMFGSTIADYIYSLETATAGAGVAFFKKLFPKPYYAYNAGELKSVEGLQSHDMVGFNAWDEEWQNGYYDTKGVFVSNSGYVACKNKIKIVSSIRYNIHSDNGNIGRICFYDGDEGFISTISNVNSTVTDYIVTTPKDAMYMTFDMKSTYGTTYNNDICINISWDGERDGEYEPYVKHSYSLDSSLVLRGIFELDENNKLRCDGDVYHADGTVERKYGIVDLGTLTWNLYSVTQGNLFRTYISAAKQTATTDVANARTEKYVTVAQTQRANKTLSCNASMFDIIDSDYSDAATFKTAMSGVYLIYELAEPTTEEAEPYQTPQIVDDFGTEEYVTDSIVPVGHVTKYMPNLKAKLEMAPDSPSDNGDYIVRHTNGLNEYVPLVIPNELPTMPSEDGTYRLKVTVSNGTATLSWESES